ncbi:hypothetical protein EC2866750_0043 [Escherichia coli 2866750]|nr:hypothetical protein EC2866750_0043 [Escherichia coli 2866750]EMW65905.1 hypothetical protein EC2756500_0042 [Escherichia coli 2756500]EMX45358.1 hypothetical protein ECJURUA2010_4934 [Escherichia coli Jurua 20/10]
MIYPGYKKLSPLYVKHKPSSTGARMMLSKILRSAGESTLSHWTRHITMKQKQTVSCKV